MNWQFITYLALVPATAMALLGSIALSWRWRETARGSALILLQITMLAWLVADTIQLALPGQTGTVIFLRITYIFIILTPVAWWYFCLVYSGVYDRFSRIFPLFLGLPILHIVLVWTNPVHSLMWTSREFIQVLGFTAINGHGYGIFFFIHSAYSYLLVFGGITVMAYNIYSGPEFYRKQLNPFLLAVGLMIGYNLLQVLKVLPGQKDFSPIFSALPGIAMVYSMLKYQLLEIQPVTRDTLIDFLQDGIVILNEENRIIDINRSAKNILGLSEKQHLVGDLIEIFFPEYSKFYLHGGEGPIESFKWSVVVGDQDLHYDVRLKILNNGKILTFHNTTETEDLFEKVQQLAAIDPLTQIYNRRELFRRAEEALNIAIRYDRPLSIMLIDMDHFKEYNDRYGHQVGDEILVTFARFCQKRLRATDIIGRYGGDEFIIVIPETNIEQAAQLARKMIRDIKGFMTDECGENCEISISIGLAEYSESEDVITLDELIHRADQALYQAKDQGRDQFVVWDVRLNNFDYIS